MKRECYREVEVVGEEAVCGRAGRDARAGAQVAPSGPNSYISTGILELQGRAGQFEAGQCSAVQRSAV